MKFLRFSPEGSSQVLQGKMSDGEAVITEDTEYPLSEVTLLPPVHPSKVVCVALNYRGHAEETNSPVPDRPSFFLKPPSAVVGPNQSIHRPSADRVDYEAEIGVLIAETCRDVEESEALDYVWGYTCFNDVSNRDAQSWEQNWVRAKGFDTSAPLGPWVATPDEMPDPIPVESYLNSEKKQSSDSSDMIFSIPTLIAEISQFMTLHRGDLLATGTPPGIGPLEAGDQVSIKVGGVGTLTNGVI
ncbi:MAG: fumarylacetoacetate hydrolase family protein [Candidatus Acetothermia bacterium]